MSRDSDFAYLLMRDGARCYICGQASDPHDPLQDEHRKPKADALSIDVDDMSNRRLAHRSCNQRKGTRHVKAS